MQQETKKQVDDILDQLKEVEVTAEILEGLYLYLDMHYDSFDDEQKMYWSILMEKIDPEFNNEN